MRENNINIIRETEYWFETRESNSRPFYIFKKKFIPNEYSCPFAKQTNHSSFSSVNKWFKTSSSSTSDPSDFRINLSISKPNLASAWNKNH